MRKIYLLAWIKTTESGSSLALGSKTYSFRLKTKRGLMLLRFVALDIIRKLSKWILFNNIYLRTWSWDNSTLGQRKARLFLRR